MNGRADPRTSSGCFRRTRRRSRQTALGGERVRSVGAEHVIDHTQESFVEREARYDLILDNLGNHSLLDIRHALKPHGVLVIVSGPKDNLWIGPLSRWVKARVLSRFVDEQLVTFVARLNAGDLQTLSDLANEGKLTPIIDERYTLSEIPEAIRYIETRRGRGKIVINIDNYTKLASLRASLARTNRYVTRSEHDCRSRRSPRTSIAQRTDRQVVSSQISRIGICGLGVRMIAYKRLRC